ncbi:hypothetical protein [Sinomonas susongensis]|uniref:hypothetical protein n=1 Tax=Sinomonas susongensis TaxID=1324851 RepID=UPI001108EB50|nr:hypothetical protein [Sinomonas susongensis]
MPWWFWFLLWAALLLGSAAGAACAGVWLVRKALRFLRDAGSSFSELFAARPVAEAGSDEAESVGDLARPLPGSAVFDRPDEVRRAYDQGKAARRAARRERRISRRAQRGQAQSPRDLGLI